jgi:transcription initiation factor TFIIB
MISASDRICPVCGSKNIIIDDRGQSVCRECGTVIDSRVTMATYTPKMFSEQQSGSGYGLPRDIMYPQSISGTEISISPRDIEGHRMTMKGIRGIQRLRVLQRKMQMMRSHERHLSRILNEVQTIINQLGLPRQIQENAAYIYRVYMKKKGSSKSRSVRGAAAAAIFMASRITGNPVTIEELSKTTGIPKRDINRCYKTLRLAISELKPELVSKLHGSPEHFVTQIVSRLNLPIEVQAKAKEILENASKLGITSGKEPQGLAAAAVYMASILTNNKRTQHEIAEAARITEVTIRNRYKELMTALDIKYTL